MGGSGDREMVTADTVVWEAVADEAHTGEHAGKMASIAVAVVGVHNSAACKAVDIVEEAEKRSVEEERILATKEGMVEELSLFDQTTSDNLIALVLARDKIVAPGYEVLQWEMWAGNAHPRVHLSQPRARGLLVG